MAPSSSEFFREVTIRICGSLDVDQALWQVFDYVKHHLPVDAMGLAFNDLDGARLVPVAMASGADYSFLWDRTAEEIPLSKEYVEYIRSKPNERPSITLVNRPSEAPAAAQGIFSRQLGESSFLGLRLDLRGQSTGMLVLAARGVDRYTADHVALIERVKEPFAIAMSNARRYRELVRLKDLLAEDNRALAADIKRSTGVEVIGADFGLREVMEHVRQISPSSSPALLLGETGTGKEVIANAIHMASARSSGPMISMQCGAVPDTLLDSELFGHEKGAFTGASERKRGRFERADGGTLFLDEVGELSPDAQVKLLRVLQEQRFERVGGTKTIEVDVRVIAAPHRNLERMVREGRFREDLWYRLNVLPIRIPPLRMRRDDVPSLVLHFVEKKTREMNLQRTPRVASHDLERLKAYDWPGNVRELQNIVERALILSGGDHLRFPDLANGRLSSEDRSVASTVEPIRPLDTVMADYIRQTLARAGGQIAGPGGAAELLGIHPNTLRSRMKRLGVPTRP